MTGNGNRPYILIYGRDRVLLHTRQLVLEKGHFEVVAVETEAEARDKLYARTVAVFILCHSLSWEACSSALTMAKNSSARSFTIVMDAGAAASVAHLCDETFDFSRGPVALIDTVKRLAELQTKPPATRPLHIMTRPR